VASVLSTLSTAPSGHLISFNEKGVGDRLRATALTSISVPGATRKSVAVASVKSPAQAIMSSRTSFFFRARQEASGARSSAAS
jgi:hypothetical protein